jgi:AraC-like DNA-binding protein/mannose-6-phosphate isomerase-like protein (cupin superfamily)
MLPDLLDTALSPLERTMKRIMTEYVAGKASKEEILTSAQHTITNEIDLTTCRRLLENECLDDFIDENMLDDMQIMMMKQARYFPAIMHSHGFFEVIYVFRGKCLNVFPDSLFEMKEGDIFFIPPGMEHSESVCDDNSIVVNIFLQKKTFQNAFSGLIDKHDVFSEFFSNALYAANKTTAIYLHCDSAMNGFIHTAYREIDPEQRELTTRILNLRFQLLIAYIMRDFKDRVRLYESGSMKNPIQPLLRYLQKEYATATRVSTAQRFGYNSDYLNCLVKQHTGKTFLELLTQIRMRKASDLLSNTKINIEKIAENCGYMGKSNFYAAFKKEFGITPMQYRETDSQPS